MPCSCFYRLENEPHVTAESCFSPHCVQHVMDLCLLCLAPNQQITFCKLVNARVQVLLNLASSECMLYRLWKRYRGNSVIIRGLVEVTLELCFLQHRSMVWFTRLLNSINKIYWLITGYCKIFSFRDLAHYQKDHAIIKVSDLLIASRPHSPSEHFYTKPWWFPIMPRWVKF